MEIKEIKKSDVELTMKLNQKDINFLFAIMSNVSGYPSKSLRSIADEFYYILEEHVNEDYSVYLNGSINCEEMTKEI